jgi:hypothetical protein
VVKRSHVKFTACFKRWSAELPSESGKVMLELVVSGAGRVTGVQADLDAARSPALDKCLAGEARRLRFPPHTDAELRFGFPLVYRRGEH